MYHANIGPNLTLLMNLLLAMIYVYNYARSSHSNDRRY